MPPEIVSHSKYDSKVDVWSAGVVTYFLLTGEPPFDGDSIEVIYKAIQEDELDLEKASINGLLSDVAKDFIQKVLNKNPEERMTAAECLKHPWLAQKRSVTPG